MAASLCIAGWPAARLPSALSRGIGRRVACGKAADLEQFQPERLDLGQHAVQGGLVGSDTLQQRIAVFALGVQGRERAPHRRAQVAAAAGWHADHGYPVEAVRHAQAAQDWSLAARLLADHWVGLGLNGLGATAYELLARFPAGVIAGDAELAAPMAWHELERGSLEEAERYVVLAAEGLDSVPAVRRGRSQVALAVVRLQVARQRGDLPAVAETRWPGQGGQGGTGGRTAPPYRGVTGGLPPGG